MNNYKKIIIGLALLVPAIMYAAPVVTDQLASVFVKYLELNVAATKAQTEQLKLLNDRLAGMQTGKVLGGTFQQKMTLTTSASATTSPTFFGFGANGQSPTATTTLVTVGCNSNVVNGQTVDDVGQIGVYLQIAATTSLATTARVHIMPEATLDCIDWYTMGSLYDQVTTAGSAVNAITYPTASSSMLTLVPGQIGISRMQLTLKNLNAKGVRFSVWGSVGSTSVWMETAAMSQLTAR